jgi:hypothetical protein
MNPTNDARQTRRAAMMPASGSDTPGNAAEKATVLSTHRTSLGLIRYCRWPNGLITVELIEAATWQTCAVVGARPRRTSAEPVHGQRLGSLTGPGACRRHSVVAAQRLDGAGREANGTHGWMIKTTEAETLDGTPIWNDLPKPRALTAAERALLETLVGHVACSALTEQTASARVIGTCGCGCGSLRLSSDGPPVPGDTIRALSSVGRDDVFSVNTMARSAPFVNVVVHVVGGMLHELEVFNGEGVPVEPPAADQLDDPVIH